MLTEPTDDVTDEVCIDPANFTRVHISDLEEVVDARVTRSTTAVDYLPGSIKPDARDLAAISFSCSFRELRKMDHQSASGLAASCFFGKQATKIPTTRDVF